MSGIDLTIVPWHDYQVEFVRACFAPVPVLNIVPRVESHAMCVIVADDQMRPAMDEVTMVARLTGWTIHVMTLRDARALHVPLA
jgi:transcription antitermination factor NusA-like protein